MLSPEELESLAQEHGLLVSDAPPAAPPPPDYEALAQKHGLLVSDAPPAAPPPPDYEALAQKHGLVLSDRPPRGRPAIQPDYEALAKQHGLIIRDPIPGVDEPIRGLEKLGGRLPGAGAPPRLQMETPTIFRMMGGEKGPVPITPPAPSSVPAGDRYRQSDVERAVADRVVGAFRAAPRAVLGALDDVTTRIAKFPGELAGVANPIATAIEDKDSYGTTLGNIVSPFKHDPMRAVGQIAGALGYAANKVTGGGVASTLRSIGKAGADVNEAIGPSMWEKEYAGRNWQNDPTVRDDPKYWAHIAADGLGSIAGFYIAGKFLPGGAKTGARLATAVDEQLATSAMGKLSAARPVLVQMAAEAPGTAASSALETLIDATDSYDTSIKDHKATPKQAWNAFAQTVQREGIGTFLTNLAGVYSPEIKGIKGKIVHGTLDPGMEMFQESIVQGMQQRQAINENVPGANIPLMQGVPEELMGSGIPAVIFGAAQRTASRFKGAQPGPPGAPPGQRLLEAPPRSMGPAGDSDTFVSEGVTYTRQPDGSWSAAQGPAGLLEAPGPARPQPGVPPRALLEKPPIQAGPVGGFAEPSTTFVRDGVTYSLQPDGSYRGVPPPAPWVPPRGLLEKPPIRMGPVTAPLGEVGREPTAPAAATPATPMADTAAAAETPSFDEFVAATEAPAAGTTPVTEKSDIYADVVKHVQQLDRVGTSILQRQFRLRYDAASAMLDRMEADGIVGPADGSKPREVLKPTPPAADTAQEKEEQTPAAQTLEEQLAASVADPTARPTIPPAKPGPDYSAQHEEKRVLRLDKLEALAAEHGITREGLAELTAEDRAAFLKQFDQNWPSFEARAKAKGIKLASDAEGRQTTRRLFLERLQTPPETTESAALPAPDIKAPEAQAVTGFETTKGSKYTTAGSGTQRFKTETGEQFKPSDSTVYITPAVNQRVLESLQSGNIGSTRASVRIVGDKLAVVVKDRDSGKIRNDLSKTVPYSDTPEVGLHPVEVWNKNPETGEYGFHLGHPIARVTSQSATPATPSKVAEPAKPKSWKPELQVQGEGDKWHDNSYRFATKEEAEAAAKENYSRWMLAKDHRAVESEDEPTHQWDADANRAREIEEKPVTPEVVTPEKQEKPEKRLVARIRQAIDSGEDIRLNLEKIAEETFGGTRAAGDFDKRKIYELQETAVNQWMADHGDELLNKLSPKQALERIRGVLSRLATQTVRSDEQIRKQQFSTPPTIAYLVNKLANPQSNDVAFEPSAGTGGLVAAMRDVVKATHINEIDPERAALAESVGFPKATAHDGENIHSALHPSVKPTVIVMNPPFSAGALKGTAETPAANRTKYGFNHVNSALQRLEPGGRLVAILSGGMEGREQGARLDAPVAQAHWEKIAKRYTLKANVGISGKEYSKYGTSFPTRIIVIDKTGPTPGATWSEQRQSIYSGDFDTVEDAWKALQPISEERKAVTGDTKAPGKEPAATGVGGHRGGVAPQPGVRPQGAGEGGTDRGGGGRGDVSTDVGGHQDTGIDTEQPGALQPAAEHGGKVDTKPAGDVKGATELGGNLGGGQDLTDLEDLAGEFGISLDDLVKQGSKALGQTLGTAAAPETETKPQRTADEALNDFKVGDRVSFYNPPTRSTITGTVLEKVPTRPNLIPGERDITPKLRVRIETEDSGRVKLGGQTSVGPLEATKIEEAAAPPPAPSGDMTEPAAKAFIAQSKEQLGDGYNFEEGMQWQGGVSTLTLKADGKRVLSLRSDDGKVFRLETDKRANFPHKTLDDVIAGGGRTQAPPAPKPSKPKAETKRETAARKAKEAAEAPKVPDALKKAADEARKRLLDKMRGTTLSSGLDPTILVDLATIGAEKIAGGAKQFKTWASEMMGDLGPMVNALAKKVGQTVDTFIRKIYKAARLIAGTHGIESEAAPAPEESGDIEVRTLPKKQSEEDAGAFVVYQPTLAGKPHPGSIVESKSMSTVALPPLTYQPSIPQSTNISDVQLEGTVITGQQNDRRNPDGTRAAALIGDGTGVGKGREIAAAVLDNWNKGRKRILWVSKTWDLAEGAKRDLIGVGADELVTKDADGNTVPVKFITLDKLIKKGPINFEGVIFSTYATLRAEDKQKKRNSHIVQEWLKGKDEAETAFTAFDEAHEMKNTVAAGSTKVSQTGTRMKELREALPNLRTGYMSATSATDVINMGYLERLGLWGPRTAFPAGFTQFVSKIGEGGVAAMELIARELKATGKYLARTLSYKGVVHEMEVARLNPEQKEIYRKAATAWRDITPKVLETIETINAGPNVRSRFESQFWSSHQRFFNILLTTLKLPKAIELAERALATVDENGKPKEPQAVVFTLVNTGEATQKRQEEKAKDDDDEESDDLDFGPREILVNLIRDNWPTQDHADGVDPTGRPIKIPLFDINPVTGLATVPRVNPQAVAERDAAIKEIEDTLHLPENPLDILINHFGRNNVAELTGRLKYYNQATGQFIPRGGDVPRKKLNILEAQRFQDGEKYVALLSGAAGTGISLQADLGAKNQRQRLHITLQPGWSADKAMQMLGRTHRSNQSRPPKYVSLATDMAGEKRFIATIAKRLASLGALTRGTTEGAGALSEDMAKVNLDSVQGRRAARTFSDQLLRDIDIPGTDLKGLAVLQTMGLLKYDGGTPYVQEDENVTRLLNRFLALDPDVQNPVFDYFYSIFEATVASAVEDGTLDTGVKELQGDRVTIKNRETLFVDPETKAPTEHYTVEVQQKYKLVTPEALEKEMSKHPDAEFYVNRKTGQIALGRETQPIVSADGGVTEAIRYIRPGSAYWVKSAKPRGTRDNRVDLMPLDEYRAWKVDQAKGDLSGAKSEQRGAEENIKWARQDQEYKATRYAESVKVDDYGRVTVRTPGFNEGFRYRARELEGQWDNPRNMWIFPQRNEAAVRAAFAEHFPAPSAPKVSPAHQEKLDEATAKVKDAQAALDAAEAQKATPAETVGKEMWEDEYDKTDKSFTSEHHLIGGAVLRFWDNISKNSGIKLAQDTETQDRVVGALIPSAELPAVIQSISGGTVRVNAGNVIADVLKNASEYQLQGGIRVRQGRVARNPVVELKVPDAATGRILTGMGVVYEKGVVGMYYIPTKDSREIMDRVLAQYPVTANAGTSGAAEGAAPSSSEAGYASPELFGAHLIAKGLRKFEDWLKGMIERYGPTIRKNAARIFMESKRLWQDDTGTLDLGALKQAAKEGARRFEKSPLGAARRVAFSSMGERIKAISPDLAEKIQKARDTGDVMAGGLSIKLHDSGLHKLSPGELGMLREVFKGQRTRAPQKVVDAYRAVGALGRDISSTLDTLGDTKRVKEVPQVFAKALKDPNPASILKPYMAETGERIGRLSQFGVGDREIKDLLKTIAASGGKGRHVAEQLGEWMKRILERPPDTAEENVSRFIRAIQSYKLGLALIGNATQPAATITLAGDPQALIAGYKSLLTSEGRRLAIESGASLESVLSEAHQQTTEGFLGKGVEKFLTPFQMGEHGNRIIAANAGVNFIQRMHKAAQGTGKHAQWAAKKVRQLGADPARPLARKDLLMAAKKFSDLTQFRTRPENLPAWASTWFGKMAFQFKSFSYLQAKFMLEQTVGELRDGHPLRAGRNLVMMAAVSGTVGELARLLRAAVTGGWEKWEEDNEDLIKRMLNDMAAVGAAGMMQDFANAVQRGKDALERYALGPGLEWLADTGVLAGRDLIDTDKDLDEKGEKLRKYYYRHGPLGSVARQFEDRF